MMFNFTLAVKRGIKSVYFPILLILCTVITLFAPVLGKEEATPPAGIFDMDNTAVSTAVVESLANENFVVCDDENTLRKKVAVGEFDCGMIIKSGFSDALANNKLDNAVTFLYSPLSFSEELYKNHISAAIFERLSPVIIAEVMGDTLDEIGITAKDIASEYNRRISAGPLFTFELLDVNSAANFSDERGQAYLMFFASILIFTAVMYSVGDSASEVLSTLSERIGIRKFLLSVTLPNIVVRVFGIILSLTLSAILEMLFFGSHIVVKMLPGLIVYILLILSFSLIASVIFRKSSDFRTLTVMVLLTSVVLCPAYIDLSAIWRPITVIRGFLPTFWLWLCEDFSAVWLISIPILAIAAGIFAAGTQRAKKSNR